MRQTDIGDYNLFSPDGFAEALLRTFEVALVEPERLQTPEDIDRFLAGQGISAPTATGEDVAGVRTFREELRTLFDETRAEPDRADQLNAMLGRVPVVLSLQPETYSLGVRAPASVTLFDQVYCAGVVGLASSVSRHGFSRLRICAADPCRDAFIDTSKKGSRRFCSLKCANRRHVATFRQRKREGNSAE